MYPQRSVMTCGLATALEPPHFNHAPVRGATGASFSRRSRAGSFNPRTRVGCDQSLVLYHRAAREFQSTHPRGVRLTGHMPAIQDSAFQSTHPRGVRLADYMGIPSGIPFQSTHPRGVRHGILIGLGHIALVSIHAPAWGATLFLDQPSARRGVSIHAPAWGATGVVVFTHKTAGLFQSTHPRGVRLSV